IRRSPTRKHTALDLQAGELRRPEYAQPGHWVVLRQDDHFYPLGARRIEREQLLHQRQCYALPRRHVEPRVLQRDVRGFAVTLEDAVFLLEVKERARRYRDDELALDRVRHADNLAFSQQEVAGIDGQLVRLERAPDAIGLAACGLGLARKIDELLRAQRHTLRIQHDCNARLQLARAVLREYHANLARSELDRGADGIDADALDELLDQRLVEKLAARFVEHAHGARGRHLPGIGPRRGQRGEAVDDGRHRAEQADLVALQAQRVARAVVALMMTQHDLADARGQAPRRAQDLAGVHDVALRRLILIGAEPRRLPQD